MTCQRCGLKNHKTESCRTKKKCNKCGEKGHSGRYCSKKSSELERLDSATELLAFEGAQKEGLDNLFNKIFKNQEKMFNSLEKKIEQSQKSIETKIAKMEQSQDSLLARTGFIVQSMLTDSLTIDEGKNYGNAFTTCILNLSCQEKSPSCWRAL
eukprot:NODE_1057_length_2401_cov_0.724153.p2 type:complete len:154 gc:universal NODE_1057_length_2401_cov_0.724153:1759-2220(+)